MAASKKKEIELLPREDWEKTSTGKFLKWTLGTGRYIVILTELVVILAFISRFKLDRDLTNLYEDIQQKQRIVETNQSFENEFRFLQDRLKVVKTLTKEQKTAPEVIDKLLPLVPLDVSFENLSVSNQEISLKGFSLSEQGFASFLKNLKKSPFFENLVLTGVNTGTKTAQTIQFEIKAEFSLSGEKKN